MKIQSGVCVIVNLTDPKEKFWGVIEDLNEAGVYLRGIDLSSYDELLRLLARGEEGIYPGSVFFPLRRVERILLDEANGTIPSMIGRFEEYTGVKLINYLGLG